MAVTAAAEKAIIAEYQRVVANINAAASKEVSNKVVFVGFEKEQLTDYDDYPGYDVTAADSVLGNSGVLPQGIEKTTIVYKYQFSVQLKTSDDVVASTFKTAAAVAESKAAKDAAYQAVGAITLDGVYSEEYKNTAKSDYDLASELVNKALEALNQISDATTVATAEDNIDLVDSIYTAPVGEAKAAGALYIGGKVTVDKEYDFGKGLDAITKIADQEYADADLTYAQNKTLNTVLGNLAEEKDKVLAAYNAELRNQRDAKKPDTDLISDITKYMADVESAYNDAVAAITYLVKYTEKVNQLGTYSNTGFEVNGVKWKFDVSVSITLDKAHPEALLDAFQAKTITAVTYTGTAPLTVGVTEEMAEKVAAAEKQAANDKVYLNLDGSYAVQIEKALEEAKESIYTKNVNSYRTPTNTSELDDRKVELVMGAKGKVIVNGKEYKTVNEWKKNANAVGTYEKDQFDEIRAIVTETKAAIKDAKTIADAEAAFVAGYEKMDAVPTAQSHKNAFTLKNGALTDKFDKYAANFNAYVTAKESALNDLKIRKDYDFTVSTLQNYFTTKWTGEFYKSVYTSEELDAKYAEALAVVDNLKTKAEMKTQYDAVLTTLNALPAEATVADKEAIKAARDAYDEYADYVEMIGAANIFTTDGTYTKALDKLVNAENAVARAERKAIADAFKALPAVEKITVSDAPAVEAIRTMIDAYVADRVKKDATNTDINNLYNEAIGGAPNLGKFEDNGGYEEAVVRAYRDVAQDLIAKLAVSPVDAVAVKAAREAYNAIPDHLFSGYVDVDLDVPEYDKLVALEKVVAVYVQALKITASSKATKGAITVKWTVKGNTTAADGYQIWKSTKKNSGYKKAFTTSKTSYKNTKGLKKGTRYYYKVRAFKVVDGVNVYSDWSNKAYRTAK